MMNKNVFNFNAHGSRLTTILTHTKCLKDDSLSMTKNIIGICVTCFFLTTSILFILSEIIDIKNSHDLPNFASHVNPICFHFSGTAKWIFGIKRVDELRELLERMERCHQQCLKINNHDKDYHIYRMKIIKFKKDMYIFSFGYSILLIYGVMHWILNPIFYDFYIDFYGIREINSSFSRHLPFPGVYPWKIDNNSKYISTFILQTIGGIGSGIGHWIYDVMTICFLVCVSCHFEYLNETLIDQRDNASILSGEFAVQKFKNKLRNCLIHHREILEFIEKLSKEMSFPLFIVCSQSTISLCLISLEVSTMKLDSSIESIMRASTLLELWLGINIELSLYCYLGTKLQQLGLDIADAIYLCDWEQAVNSNGNKYENFENNNQHAITNINQMIQFSLMRAQKPIVLIGGLFYTLSLETYKALIGFSLSNAVILRQVSEE